MVGIETLRDLIGRVLQEQTRVPFAHGDIKLESVFDTATDRYLLVLVGRDGGRRVHGCLVHVDVIDGMVWIQRDGTERGIARDLMNAGIPADQILLATRATPPVSAAAVG